VISSWAKSNNAMESTKTRRKRKLTSGLKNSNRLLKAAPFALKVNGAVPPPLITAGCFDFRLNGP